MKQMLEDVLTQVEKVVGSVIADAVRVHAVHCGLDDRCGYLTVGEDFIAVEAYGERNLQYYGGYEYVDAEYRHVMGGWVFYDTRDDRVAGHHEQLMEHIGALD